MSKVEARTVVAVAQAALASGVFHDSIEQVVVDQVRAGKDDGLTEIGFILKMAVELMDRSAPRLSFERAKHVASSAYAAFHHDNPGVQFGDPNWDWSGAAARELIHEYEIDHWEPSP